MARSAARIRSNDPVAVRPRAIVRDFSRSRNSTSPDVEFDVRTVYDFVFSLSEEAGSVDDLPAPDRVWLAEARAGLRETVGEAFDDYRTDLCVVMAGLAVDRPEVRDAAGFVALLDSLDDDTVIRAILAEDLRDPERRAATELAIAGNDDAIRARVAEMAEGHGPEAQTRYEAMYRDPAGALEPVRTVIAAWLPRFQTIEARVAAMIRRDVDSRVGDLASLSATDLIERTTGGIRWLAEPGVRRVILAPSYFARPYNYALGGHDWRLFGYPIGDEAVVDVDPLAPPPAVVRLHRALGDETRLRILRLLATRDHYLTEIATALDLSKPTIKHHLALMRAAGLVTLTEEGGLSYYSLRRGAIEASGMGLSEYLGS
jgi:DNA-binding transcriptional ArsR family regulator